MRDNSARVGELLRGRIFYCLSPNPGISTIASAYIGLEGIKPYDGNIIHIGLWDMDERPGEIASFDLWPLFGVGIGIVGARAHVLPIDAGVGAIWYQPVPAYEEVTEAEDVHY